MKAKYLVFTITTITLVVFGYFIFGKRSQTHIPNLTPSPVATIIPETACEKYIDGNPGEPITNFQGTPAPVNFSSFPQAKQYYTAITTQATKGSNFAGHFNIVTWGCGTDTIAYAIVDSKTGDMVNYQECLANTHIRYSQNQLSTRYLILTPVYKGEDIKYYELIEKTGERPTLQLLCTEKSTKDMYSFPE